MKLKVTLFILLASAFTSNCFAKTEKAKEGMRKTASTGLAEDLRIGVGSVGFRIFGNHTQGFLIYGKAQNGSPYEVEFNSTSGQDAAIFEGCLLVFTAAIGKAVIVERSGPADNPIVRGCSIY